MAVCHYSDSPLVPYPRLMTLRRSDTVDDGPPGPSLARGACRNAFIGTSFIR
jgi:hypothetical protein